MADETAADDLAARVEALEAAVRDMQRTLAALSARLPEPPEARPPLRSRGMLGRPKSSI